MSRARTRLIALDSLALIITQNLQSLRDWGCARHTRAHTRIGQKIAEPPGDPYGHGWFLCGNLHRKQRKNLSSPATLCKIPINVLIHSTTAAETCQVRRPRLFCPGKGDAGVFCFPFLFLYTQRRGSAFGAVQVRHWQSAHFVNCNNIFETKQVVFA